MKTTNTARAAYIPTRRHHRARIGTAMSPARRNAFLDGFVARINAGRVTVAQYLACLGADAEFLRRYASSFGAKAAKAFEAEYGVKPPKTGLARVGRRLFRAYAYTTDQLAVLDKAARNYDKTAALIDTHAQETPVTETGIDKTGTTPDQDMTFGEVVIDAAAHLRRLAKYPPVSPFARARIEDRVHAAADRVGVSHGDADALLVEEIEAGPVDPIRA